MPHPAHGARGGSCDLRGRVAKEEPALLWEDRHIAVLSKGAGWVVSISRNLAQNKYLSRVCRESGLRSVGELVASGKCEHLAHFVILKYKNDDSYHLSDSVDHEFGIAHRLDVDTSGAIMLGKTEEGFSHLRQAFTYHHIVKEYLCLVHGPVVRATDTIDSPISWDEERNVSSISDDGLWAKSIYTVLGRYRLKGRKKIFTMCRVVIITGRTHQIRLHMSSIGHPLVSDAKYNPRHSNTDLMWNPRLFLHAWRVGFRDTHGSWHEVKAPLPKDLTRALSNLEEIKMEVGNLATPTIRVISRRAAKENLPPPVAESTRAQADGGCSPKGAPASKPQIPPPPPVSASGYPSHPIAKAPPVMGRFPRELAPPPAEPPPPPPDAVAEVVMPAAKPGAQRAGAPWAPDEAAWEEAALALAEMGFDHTAALRALHVNRGDMLEALNMLSRVSELDFRLEAGRNGTSRLLQKRQSASPPEHGGMDANKASMERSPVLPDEQATQPMETCKPLVAAASSEPDGSKDKKPQPWARRKEAQTKLVESARQHEEEAIRQALEQSQKDENERIRRQLQRDHDELEVAVAESRKTSRRWSATSRDAEADKQLYEALEQSKRLEEERRLKQDAEDEEFERAIRESMATYENFHLAGNNDDLEQTIRQSLIDSAAPSAGLSCNEDEILREAIQLSYNETYGPDLDEMAAYHTLLEKSAAARWLDAGCSDPAGWSVGSGGGQGSSCGAHEDEVREWFLARASELDVGLDPEVLWFALYDVPDEDLEDEEALKMIFDLPRTEQLHHTVVSLICELRQQRRVARFGA